MLRNTVVKKTRDYLGKQVKVIIDRPIGSLHPKFPHIKYEVNYGFIPGTISGDGEALDAYVLGETKELQIFEGTCIAIIRREEGNDDKLIVSRNGTDFSDREIEASTYFQERYFTSKIIR